MRISICIISVVIIISHCLFVFWEGSTQINGHPPRYFYLSHGFINSPFNFYCKYYPNNFNVHSF